MSLFYSILYRLGFTPWESAAQHPAAADHVLKLFDREQSERTPPFGRALDLGCGRGDWAIVLAQRGWEVTGVDLVTRAVRDARAKVAAAGANVTIVQGDITAMRAAGVEGPFHFIWDFGTLHGLSPTQRRAVGREVSALASADATLLILAWTPGSRGPLPRGASRQDLEDAFAGWTITDVQPFDATGLPKPLRNVQPQMHRFRRTPASPDS